MKIKWISFTVWIVSILVFVIAQILAPSDYASITNNPWGKVFGTSVVLGIGSFILMLLSIYLKTGEKKQKKKLSKKSKGGDDFGKQKYYLVGGVIILFLSVGLLSAKEAKLKQEQRARLYNLSQTAIPSPTSTPTPTPTPKVYVNPDPITDCVSSAPNCKGESIRLKRSQCSNITCCGFNDGRWEVYPSSDKCKQAQQGSQPIQQIQKPTIPTTQLNFYCYDNTYKYSYYTSSGEQCNKNNRISSCMGLVKSIYDSCMNSCLNQANQDSHTCIYGYEPSSPEYQQCMSAHDTRHQSCMDACSGPYQSNSLNCNNTP